MGPSPSCVSLGKPLNLSELWFLHWQKTGMLFVGLQRGWHDTEPSA